MTIIDRTNHHLFQPLLYQVATGILSEGEIAPAIRDILRKYRSLRVVLADVQRVDIEAHLVHADAFGQPALHRLRQPDRRRRGRPRSYFGHDELRARPGA